MNLGLVEIPNNWLEEIINLSAEHIVVVNREGIICYINSAYCEFLGTKIESALGKPVQDVIENTRMHIVAKTGERELAALQPINGTEMIANRYPLIVNGELVGALGTVMFRNPDELRVYKNKIEQLAEELSFYRKKAEKEMKSKYCFDDLIGTSPSFLAAKRLSERISGSQSSVFIKGESGTGKELFAHAIHNNSLRANQPFVPINCASIPEHLLESELFGYEDGAFTGAKKGGKKGLFQIAHNGTLFLDEIGDMPMPMQSKLLRALQEKEIHRIGGHKAIPVNVRIISATHRDLEKMVEDGAFRRDLYYRLNVVKIEIPPLRERKADIELLASKLLEKLEKKFYRKGIELSSQVIERLQQHTWLGNIRELENVLERAINVLNGNKIELIHLPLYLQEPAIETKNNQPIEVFSQPMQTSSPKPLKEIVALVEKQAILNALAAANGNKLDAARILEVGKTSFYEKCKLYQIK